MNFFPCSNSISVMIVVIIARPAVSSPLSNATDCTLDVCLPEYASVIFLNMKHEIFMEIIVSIVAGLFFDLLFSIPA